MISLFRKEPPDTVAAVDLGSNSFHMIVAKISGGEPVVIDRMREMVRLAAGLDEKNHIHPQAWDRALGCLSRFGQRLSAIPRGAVRAVGTNTLRKARNATAFLQEAERVLGHSIEIISGVEEARLIYEGVAHSLVHDPVKRRLVVDIGGGSTELIIGEKLEPMHMESLYMGCVSASQTHFLNGTISPNAMRNAILAAQMELEPHMATFQFGNWVEAVGASGTVRAVYSVAEREGWCQNTLTLKAMRKMVEVISQAGHVDKLGLKGLKDERRAVFPGGVAILFALFECLNIESLAPADTALREGVLYDLIGRIHQQDARDRTVAQIIKRLNIDVKQSERVKTTAVTMLQQASEPWNLQDETWERLLQWSAQLHEAGLSIAHSQYHKHGAYIIENADLMGFSRQEQSMLAVLVRSHRRKFPTFAFKRWPAKTRNQLISLAVILRLAVVLHRSRNAKNPPRLLTFKPDKRALTLIFEEGWLQNNPLTQADLKGEALYMAGTGFTLTYR